MFLEQQQSPMQQSQTASRHVDAAIARLGWRESMVVKRLNRLRFGVLRLTLPGGESIVFEGGEPGPEAVLTMLSPRMVNRLWRSGSSGFAEGYMHGDWDSPDLATLIYLLHLNAAALEPDFSDRKSTRLNS